MFGRIVFWALLPLSAAQGLLLRRRATRLPGADGPRRGAAGEGPPLYLLAIGDSIIDGVGAGEITRSLPVQFATALAAESGRKVSWQIEGRTGLDIEDLNERLESIDPPEPPQLVLLSVGVNDVTGLSSTRRWRRQVAALLSRLEARWPGVRVIFAGLPPMALFPLPPQPLRFSLGLRAATLDRIAAEVIDGFPNAKHVPTNINPQVHNFCEDGFHPSAESCTLWARELAAIESRSVQT
ncbi:MAG: SGNH/GDSL hydrolase family protein [Xanthomonadales bacterium]|nr:SGNH/GDSL hydrolase family protein [Gammaproteobacteria bacterium]NNJ65855.1 SGNH/GDSL hydrolase family protein [Xanthomonadales bacterium]NNK33132.1 SGNH/GDSL hydrolase family protein [Xanthomonadales bacterium]NNK37513.1 SGNH/GDSL hydrolase family protein [Xanthomonadales bacterium]